MIHDDAFILSGALGNDCPDAVFGSIAFNNEGFDLFGSGADKIGAVIRAVLCFFSSRPHSHFMSDPVSAVSGAATDEKCATNLR